MMQSSFSTRTHNVNCLDLITIKGFVESSSLLTVSAVFPVTENTQYNN